MVPVPAAQLLNAQKYQSNCQNKAEDGAEKRQAQGGPKTREEQRFAVIEHVHHGLEEGGGGTLHLGDLPNHLK